MGDAYTAFSPFITTSKVNQPTLKLVRLCRKLILANRKCNWKKAISFLFTSSRCVGVELAITRRMISSPAERTARAYKCSALTNELRREGKSSMDLRSESKDFGTLAKFGAKSREFTVHAFIVIRAKRVVLSLPFSFPPSPQTMLKHASDP